MASFSEFMPLERDTWADVMSSGDAHAIHDVHSMSLWVLSVSNADIYAWNQAPSASARQALACTESLQQAQQRCYAGTT